jgi:hypothetical protein
LPQDNGQVHYHDILCCPSSPGRGRIDGQQASRVLLRLIFVDIGDLEVRRPLNGPETRSKCGDSARILLPMFVLPIPGRGVGTRSSRPSPERNIGRSCHRLDSCCTISRRYTVISVVLLPTPYLIFMPPVARSADGASRVPSTVDGVTQVVRDVRGVEDDWSPMYAADGSPPHLEFAEGRRLSAPALLQLHSACSTLGRSRGTSFEREEGSLAGV